MTNQSCIDVSVVICTYTEARWHQLVMAIESIQRQCIPPKEIIVVIDHNMHLLERVRMHLAEVKVTENRGDKGLSGARNSGIAKAKGVLIAFLDDDAEAEPTWLLKLRECCTNPRVVGAGGFVSPLWEEKRPGWFPKEFYWVMGCSYQPLSQKAIVVRNPFGGCMCIQRKILEDVGGFRNGIGRVGTRPLGGEETELCIRIKQHFPQKVFIYEPQAKIHHHIPSQRATLHYFLLRCYSEGLSKAFIAKYVGAKESLSSERTYTFQVLPQGIMRGIKDAFLVFDLNGLLRAGAIFVGFTATLIGYLAGTIAGHLRFDKNFSANSTSIQSLRNSKVQEI